MSLKMTTKRMIIAVYNITNDVTSRCYYLMVSLMVSLLVVIISLCAFLRPSCPGAHGSCRIAAAPRRCDS